MHLAIRAPNLLLLLMAATSIACGDDAQPAGSGGAGGGSETADGGGGSAAGVGCRCDDGWIEVPPCGDDDSHCEQKTCGDDVVGCRKVVPCDANACVADTVGGLGCTTVGEECQTIDCHGDPAATFLCTEEHRWTDRDDLYFTCGDETCTHGLEYCEDVSDAGLNRVMRCLPMPAECAADDFCPCAPAMEVCADATCATFGGGGWIVSCW